MVRITTVHHIPTPDIIHFHLTINNQNQTHKRKVPIVERQISAVQISKWVLKNYGNYQKLSIFHQGQLITD